LVVDSCTKRRLPARQGREAVYYLLLF
jgi:hypothetical protein